MTAFVRHVGKAVLLARDNVDTDLIIPMQPLLERPRAELGRWAFKAIRYAEDGTALPGFAFHEPGAEGGSVIVAGRNFGCGSSREGAVYALEAMGIRAVLASSFGDIFFGNAVKNGLLPVQLDEASLAALTRTLAALPPAERIASVDLPAQEVTLPGDDTHRFDIHPASKAQLLEGRDEVARTLELLDDLEAFQARQAAIRAWIAAPRPA